MNAGWVYIITNRPFGTLDVGITNNLERRVWEHRHGVGSAFTARYKLKKLVFADGHEDIRHAIHRDARMKHWPRMRKLNLIEIKQPTLGGFVRAVPFLKTCRSGWPGRSLPQRRRGPGHYDPVSYLNNTREASSAASTTGAGNRKKNAVNNPVAATTNDTAGGRRSNPSTAGSKYITLITRI